MHAVTQPSTRTPRPHPPAVEDAVEATSLPRAARPVSAGRVVATVLLVLLLGSLLDARGLRKTAVGQPVGVRREVALAVTGRLVSIAAATRLDLPRRALKDAIGRSGDDYIATTIALPPEAAHSTPARSPAPAATPTPTVTTPARPRAPPRAAPAVSYTRAHPLRIWPAGDSFLIEPAYALERLASRVPIRVLPVEGRVATGLERPDVYDWFARIREVAPSLRGGVALLAFGGNDDNAYMSALPAGVRITAFWSRAWRREYGRRVGGVLDMLVSHGVYVVWIGLPRTRDRHQSDRYAQLNATVRREVRHRSGSVTYIDTFWRLSDHGHYAEYLRTASGKLVDMRQPDGVHLTPAAADIVARAVLTALEQRFHLKAGG